MSDNGLLIPQRRFCFETFIENARLPARATEKSAAYDIFLPDQILDKKGEFVIDAGVTYMINTGIYVMWERVPADYCMLLLARSGLAIKHGITLANGLGLIDPDYDDPLIVGLRNVTTKAYTFKRGDKIAQAMLSPFAVGSEKVTQKRTGGLGSTDFNRGTGDA